MRCERSVACSKANFPQSNAFCFKVKHLLSSLRSSSRCLRLIPRFTFPSIFLSIMCFRMQFYARYNQSIKPSFVRRIRKLRKVTISFVMFVRPSIRTEHLGFHWKDFHDNGCLKIFRRSVDNIKFSLKFDKTNKYFT
jgi:hypothetical protein